MNAAGALLLAAGVVAPIASCGPDGDGAGSKRDVRDAGPGLRVERGGGPRGSELIVYVEDGADDVPETARGREASASGASTPMEGCSSESASRDFTDTDDGLTEAHVHQRMSRSLANRISRCELGGTRGPLRGAVTSAAFR